MPEGKLAVIAYQNWSLTGRSTHSKVWFGARINERLDYAIAQAVIVDGQRTVLPVSESLLRYFIVDGLAIAARGTFNAGQFIALGPELHFQRKWGAFQLTMNAAFRPPIVPQGPVPALAIVAPEVCLHPRFSVYVESDATVDFRSPGTSVVVTPGVSGIIGERQLLSAGVEVGVVPSAATSSARGTWSCSETADPRDRARSSSKASSRQLLNCRVMSRPMTRRCTSEVPS
ncbi:hypothetical protein [Plesiocystis pacifica]|uniref:hypothetical protein n=1 Tax=Plesiocystis pacifica TaxID=191768 RepID=UPI0012F766C7|nr:hypothetical protein [Plesiocystis pacifica]